MVTETGGLAQLARAPDLHSGGQGFDSLILHKKQRSCSLLAMSREEEVARQEFKKY